MTTIIGIDNETHLIRPAQLCPPVVCVTWAQGDGRGIFHRTDPKLRDFLEHCYTGDAILTGANIAYDVAGHLDYAPELADAIFRAYDDDRILDVQINEKLSDIARGRLGGSIDHRGKMSTRRYALADLVKLYLGKDRSAEKSDPNGWRLRYAELHDVPIERWPADAIAYAIEDADDAKDVLLAQLPDERVWRVNAAAQARAYFAVHLLSCWGIMTDPEQIDALEAATKTRFLDLTRELQAAGLVRSNGSRDTAKAKKRLIEICRANGLLIPLTDTGATKLVEIGKQLTEEGIGHNAPERDELMRLARAELETQYPSLDEDACRTTCDPLLIKYAERTSLQTIVQTHVPDLRRGVVTPIQARWDMAESGRFTCQKGRGGSLNGTQLTNPARAIMLGCEACNTTGHLLTDGARKSGTMLVADAPTCPHCRGKGEIQGPGMRECYVARPGYHFADCDFSQLESRTVAQVCKIVVGWSDLGDALNAGVDVHLDFGAQLLGIAYDDAIVKYARGDADIKEMRQLAKVANFGFPGGLGARGFVAYAASQNIRITLEQSKALRIAWLQRWTEFAHYFKLIGAECEADGVMHVVQVYSLRQRGFVPYTAACNTLFQGLGADGFKSALWEVSKRCYTRVPGSVIYGCRPVNAVHDQIIAEVPIETDHECAMEIGQVMVDACNRYLPDYPVACVPALSKHWYKDVKDRYNEAGRLIAYVP